MMSWVDSLRETPQAKWTQRKGKEKNRPTGISASSLITTEDRRASTGDRAGELPGSREQVGSPVLQHVRPCHVGNGKCSPTVCTRNPYHQAGTFQVPVTSLEVLSVA